MDNRKKRIRRTLIDLLMELAGLVVLTVFLWNLQSAAAVRQQESNSRTKLDIAQQRILQNAEEAEDNLATYDAFNQAKVDTVAYCVSRGTGTADLAALCAQWGLNSYVLLDPSGRVIEASALTSAYDPTAYPDASPVTLADGRRYYRASLPGGEMLIGGRDVSHEEALLEQLRSHAYALRTLRVGATGYVFAVDETDGTLVYHPDSSLIGQQAAAAGYDPAQYPSDYNDWITLTGTRFYCMSRSVEGCLLAAIVPESELMANAGRTTGLSVLVFAIVISLLVVYALMLRKDQCQHPTREEEYRKLGKVYVDLAVAGKIRNVALLGLVVVFLATFYMQTLSALSRQAVVSDTKLNAVEEILADNEARIDELTDEYNAEYVQRAKNIAWTLAQDPTLLTEEGLGELTNKAQITAIYVFNRSGRTAVTNTRYGDFVLSNDPEDQSYPFWNVVKGYVDELIQPAQQDDTATHAYIQYVGVKRMDAEGMVQLGMSPRRIANRLHTTELDYVLGSIAVENDGMLFAVDAETHAFLSHPTAKLVGRDALAYGLAPAALADEYEGEQTLDGLRYFVSSRLWNSSVVSVAVPLSTLYAQRMPMTLWTTLISFVIILLIGGLLIVGGKPSADTPKDAAETEKSARFFRVFLNNGRSRVVQSAASRWNGMRQPWTEKTPEQKLIGITGMVVSLAVIALVGWLWLSDETLQRDSIIAYIMSCKWERGINLFSLTYSVITLLEVLMVTGLLRRVLMFALSRFGARSETVGRLLDSFIKYAAIIGVLFFCLNAIGVDSTALITSAGILSLVVGLGAQSLISDILAGIFIVFEGEFRVGDIVTIGDWRGTVLEIGIRTTKIESAGSDIKIFNNSAISGVINMTKQFSYAFADVGIEYGESLERVESVLQKELPLMKDRLPAVMNGPFYKGVASLGDSSVSIRIVAQCREMDRVQLTRDMNRELKLIFDKHNINIPFPQIVLNQPAEHEHATRTEKKAAEVFVQQQKELTKDIHVRDDA